MDEEFEIQIRLRLVEAAAQLPSVRAKSDPTEAAGVALAISRVWYNYVVEAGEPEGIDDLL